MRAISHCTNELVQVIGLFQRAEYHSVSIHLNQIFHDLVLREQAVVQAVFDTDHKVDPVLALDFFYMVLDRREGGLIPKFVRVTSLFLCVPDPDAAPLRWQLKQKLAEAAPRRQESAEPVPVPLFIVISHYLS